MKQKTRILSAIGLIAAAAACILYFKPTRSASTAGPIAEKKVIPKEIRILPMGPGASKTFSEETQRQIQRFIPDVALLPATDLPANAYYRPRGRYRADSLIHWMSRQAKSNEVLLGITTVDISTTKDGKPDWGVMGLGFCPGNAAVASSFRMKNKSQFWKVAIHELGHTSGLPHCPETTCFMRDADGGNPTAEETAFCPKCSEVLVKAGWKIKD